MSRQAYPLDWPESEPRTPAHKRIASSFGVTMERARIDLFKELALLGAKGIVLSTNQQLRRDGMPYASRRAPEDPGVACFWDIDGQPHAMACDAYRDLRSNLRAIGLTIQALRSIERHGSRSLRDRAFQGFAALPADAGADAARPWRDVLGLSLSPDEHTIERRYRTLAKAAHPDRGGSNEAMAELNRARAEARAESVLTS